MNRLAARLFPLAMMTCLVLGWIACQGKREKATAKGAPTEIAEPAPAEVTEPAPVACPTPRQAGAGSNRAALVVHFDQGPQTICVAFEEDSITGFELLQRSGLTIVSQYFQNPPGETICKISNGDTTANGVGNGCDYPRESCFCHQGLFWSFWAVDTSGNWASSKLGISTATVSRGETQGQVWGDGGTSPPSCFYEDICSSLPGST